jgi:N-acetylneuraminic acid mutarotase
VDRWRIAVAKPADLSWFLLVMLFAVAAVVATASGPGTSDAPGVAETWRILPQARIGEATQAFTGVWTGRRMIVFGGVTVTREGTRTYAGASYDPATDSWSRVPDLLSGNPYGYVSVWTRKEMVAVSALGSYALDPQTDRWRRLPDGGGFGGVLAWTGRELIAWGGGCCGEASSAGFAYRPTTNRWRTLARSPLAPSQTPIGVWTGRELVILVTGIELDVPKRYPPSFARAAAYEPRTNTWRRIAPVPDRYFSWDGASATWDGREVLVVGGTLATRKGISAGLARVPLAYNPRTNRWRRLAPMSTGRAHFAAVWTGTQLLVWGGRTTTKDPHRRPSRGLAYSPATNRWSQLPQAPLRGRDDPVGVWTGKAMIVWGGTGLPGYRSFTDGAAFAPARP